MSDGLDWDAEICFYRMEEAAMKVIGIVVFAFVLTIAPNSEAAAQEMGPAEREVWGAVEARWRAWEAGDLDTMLTLYHPRFHAWNRVSGRLDGRDTLLARWKAALASEKILGVKLEPIAVEAYGKYAAVFYVSRETVKVTSGEGGAANAEPTLVSIRWSDYLVKEGRRWLFVGYGGVPCAPNEPAASVCNAAAAK